MRGRNTETQELQKLLRELAAYEKELAGMRKQLNQLTTKTAKKKPAARTAGKATRPKR